MHDLSVVMPVYNAEQTLATVIDELVQVLPSIARQYEIILVNDGSRDGSWPLMEKLAGTISQLCAIDLTRNFGQHNATLAGIRAARYGTIVTMDADGQHDPKEIATLLDALQTDCDLVYGYALHAQHTGWRNLLTRLTRAVLEDSALIPHMRRLTSFRAFRAQLRDAFSQCRMPYPILDVFLEWSTSRIAFVAVRHRQRQAGKSSSTLSRLLQLIMHHVTASSLALARWMEILGLVLGATGLASFLIGASLNGILLATGLQCFLLGVICEYSARHYHLSLGKPQSMIRTSTERL